jgi:hypothetical protein
MTNATLTSRARVVGWEMWVLLEGDTLHRTEGSSSSGQLQDTRAYLAEDS